MEVGDLAVASVGVILSLPGGISDEDAAGVDGKQERGGGLVNRPGFEWTATRWRSWSRRRRAGTRRDWAPRAPPLHGSNEKNKSFFQTSDMEEEVEAAPPPTF